MTDQNDGGPAFPTDIRSAGDDFTPHPTAGMSLRDYFAAKAMQAMVSNSDTLAKFTDVIAPADLEPTVAKVAYVMADAMLAARNQRSQPRPRFLSQP